MPEELKRAQACALRYLSYRDRSEFEVNARLNQKEFAKNIVQETIDWLTGLGYLNDERFALAWSRSRVSTKKFGEYRLRRELSAKGLKSETIEKRLRSCIPNPMNGTLPRTARKKNSPTSKESTRNQKADAWRSFSNEKVLPPKQYLKP